MQIAYNEDITISTISNLLVIEMPKWAIEAQVELMLERTDVSDPSGVPKFGGEVRNESDPTLIRSKEP